MNIHDIIVHLRLDIDSQLHHQYMKNYTSNAEAIRNSFWLLHDLPLKKSQPLLVRGFIHEIP